jgi:hypothetical protein
MNIVRNKFDFHGIREVIRKNNSSEYGKVSNPIVLFPTDVNNIARELIKMQEVKITVDLSNETTSQIVDKYRKTNITNKDFSDRLTKAKKT